MSANMSEIDISILKISFMMSAVDGHVDQSEYDCFMELARLSTFAPDFNFPQKNN